LSDPPPFSTGDRGAVPGPVWRGAPLGPGPRAALREGGPAPPPQPPTRCVWGAVFGKKPGPPPNGRIAGFFFSHRAFLPGGGQKKGALAGFPMKRFPAVFSFRKNPQTAFLSPGAWPPRREDRLGRAFEVRCYGERGGPGPPRGPPRGGGGVWGGPGPPPPGGEGGGGGAVFASFSGP